MKIVGYPSSKAIYISDTEITKGIIGLTLGLCLVVALYFWLRKKTQELSNTPTEEVKETPKPSTIPFPRVRIPSRGS